MSEQTLQFNNLAGGAVQERFNEGLQEVLDNVIDPNTDPKKARKITLTVTIKPNEERDMGAIGFDVKTSLVQSKAIVSSIIIDRNNQGQAVAAEVKKTVPGQMSIEDYNEKSAKPNVVPMQKQ